MRLLLDTHLLLWAAGDPNRLSNTARELIKDLNNQPCFSAASIWEIAIKNSLGRC
jgi:PIN domain nuclease of toxin-antitoxin system